MTDSFCSIWHCDNCNLRGGATQVVVGEGSIYSKLMILGEAPGRLEDETGRPFVGISGEFFFSILAAHGMRREQFYVTNIVKCRPPENADPSLSIIQACKGNLLLQLNVIQPKIIMTVGRMALEWFSKSKGKISVVHGQPFESTGFLIYPIFHPAYIMRNRRLEPIFREDIENFVTFYDKLRGRRKRKIKVLENRRT